MTVIIPQRRSGYTITQTNERNDICTSDGRPVPIATTNQPQDKESNHGKAKKVNAKLKRDEMNPKENNQ